MAHRCLCRSPVGSIRSTSSSTRLPIEMRLATSRTSDASSRHQRSSGRAPLGRTRITRRDRSTISAPRRLRSSESRMSVAALREEVASRSRDFAWDQWTQIGVSGHAPAVADRRAIDPEALLLFTLEAARSDPRLFDEVLDWLLLNEQLISV